MFARASVLCDTRSEASSFTGSSGPGCSIATPAVRTIAWFAATSRYASRVSSRSPPSHGIEPEARCSTMRSKPSFFSSPLAGRYMPQMRPVSLAPASIAANGVPISFACTPNARSAWTAKFSTLGPASTTSSASVSW